MVTEIECLRDFGEAGIFKGLAFVGFLVPAAQCFITTIPVACILRYEVHCIATVTLQVISLTLFMLGREGEKWFLHPVGESVRS